MVRIEPVKFMAGGVIAAVCCALLTPFNECAAESGIFVQSGPSGPGPGVDCIHLAAGDGQLTMADDAEKPLYIFSFSEVPLPSETLDSPFNGLTGAPTDLSLYAGFVMDYGLLSANAPAPTIAVDSDSLRRITVKWRHGATLPVPVFHVACRPHRSPCEGKCGIRI